MFPLSYVIQFCVACSTRPAGRDTAWDEKWAERPKCHSVLLCRLAGVIVVCVSGEYLSVLITDAKFTFFFSLLKLLLFFLFLSCIKQQLLIPHTDSSASQPQLCIHCAYLPYLIIPLHLLVSWFFIFFLSPLPSLSSFLPLHTSFLQHRPFRFHLAPNLHFFLRLS